jgi:hypothetical protein
MFSKHSRKQALALGLKHYFTGEPCKHGHIAKRYVSSAECSECSRIQTAKWDAANRERLNETKRKRRAANPEKAREREREAARKHRAADPERHRSQQAAWRAANRQKVREYRRKAYAKNKDRLAAKRAAKRAALRSAIAAGMLDAGPRGRATDR